MKNKVIKLSATIILLALCTLITSCLFKHKWSEEKWKKFENECSQTETVSNINFLFKGFGDNEIESITVREYNGKALLDSFKVFVSPAQSPIDKERKEHSATISRTMNIKYKYQFIIPNQKPYELTDMKMIMWAQYTMNSEGWGCVMGDYKIDGVRFEHSANPTFIKREKERNK